VRGDAKKGIAHIIAQRMAKDGMSEAQVLRFLTQAVPETIAMGQTVPPDPVGGTRLRIAHDGNTAFLVKGQAANSWVLTAFEDRPSDGRGVGYDTPAPTHSKPMLSRPGMGADGNTSIGQSGQDAPPLFSRSPADISRQVDAGCAGAQAVGDLDWPFGRWLFASHVP
jgi:hypothetical protein